MKTSWGLPDGGTTITKPKDGATFAHQKGNQVDYYMWDGYMEWWVPTSTVMQLNMPIEWIPITISLESMIDCKCGNKENPVGQGHSHWCDRYRKEFK